MTVKSTFALLSAVFGLLTGFTQTTYAAEVYASVGCVHNNGPFSHSGSVTRCVGSGGTSTAGTYSPGSTIAAGMSFPGLANENAYRVESKARAGFGNLGVYADQQFRNTTDPLSGVSSVGLTRDLQVTADTSWSDSFTVQSASLANGASVRAKVRYQVDVAQMNSFFTGQAGLANGAYSLLLFSAGFAGIFSEYCLASGVAAGNIDICGGILSNRQLLRVGSNTISFDADLFVGQSYTAQSVLAAVAQGYNEAVGLGTGGLGIGSGSSRADSFNSAHSYFEVVGSDATLNFASGTDYSFPESTVNTVPEPQSFALMLAGLAMLAVTRRRSKLLTS